MGRARKSFDEMIESGNQRSLQILEVAAQLFDTNGYSATTMQEIGDSAGILKGSLYSHIGSKEDLLFALVVQHHQSIDTALGGVTVEPDMQLPELLKHLTSIYLELAATHGPRFRTYQRSWFRLSEARKDQVQTERRAHIDTLGTLIAQASDHPDPTGLAVIALHSLESVGLWQEALPGHNWDAVTNV